MQGGSLRGLAAKHALGSHYRLWDHLRRLYGQGATNPQKQSLARTILRDYWGRPEYPQVLAWIAANHDKPGFNTEEAPFRARDTEHHYTQHQTVEDYRLVEEVPWDPGEPQGYDDRLRLYLFQEVFQSVAVVLGDLIGYPCREAHEAA